MQIKEMQLSMEKERLCYLSSILEEVKQINEEIKRWKK